MKPIKQSKMQVNGYILGYDLLYEGKLWGSRYDISNQNFNIKLISKKMSRLNSNNASKTRHRSLDLNSPVSNTGPQETLEVERYLFSSRKLKLLSTMTKKQQRNCSSVMKPEEYDDIKIQSKSKFMDLQKCKKLSKPALFKNLSRDRYEKVYINKKQSLSRSKKSEQSQKSINQKGKNLNGNISINIYLQNAKICTPTKPKIPLIDKHLLSNKSQDCAITKFTNKRLKTQLACVEIPREGQSRYDRYNRYGQVQSTENKSLQKWRDKILEKSREISIMDGLFWKKKSAVKARENNLERQQKSRVKKW